MARETCQGCWHPAPRGTRLGTWSGLADFDATPARPRRFANWRLCVRCARDLGVTLKYAAPIVGMPRN